MTRLASLSVLLVAVPAFAGSNSPENAQASTERDYLSKVNVDCGLSLKVRYDGASLRAHNQDIRYDQTGGDRECNEPLRYVWYACQTPAGKAALARVPVTTIECRGTAAKVGSLTLKAGTLVVERAFEEEKPFLRSRKQFEQLLDVALELGAEGSRSSEDPYSDDRWSELRQREPPVTDTRTFCVVNGKKVPFRTSLEDSFEHRKEDGRVECTKDGQPFTSLTLKAGKKTGFTTVERGDRLSREEYRDGKRHGEQRVQRAGKLVERAVFQDGEEVTRTELHESGKLARHKHRFADHLDDVSFSEDGRMQSLSCSPQAGQDPELAKWCGFGGEVTHSLYDGTGKVLAVLTFRDGVLQREAPGDSTYASRRAVSYQAGKKHGEERVFGKSGKLQSTVQWRQGVKDGKELRYAEDSEKVVEEQVWKAGELQRSTTFFLNGNPKQRALYDGPKEQRLTEYWDTGKVRVEEKRLPCPERRFRGREWCREGVQKTFYENGDRSTETSFKAGVEHGAYRAWHENGKPAEESEFADGRCVRRKTWDQNGQLLKDEEYEADGSRKLK